MRWSTADMLLMPTEGKARLAIQVDLRRTSALKQQIVSLQAENKDLRDIPMVPISHVVGCVFLSCAEVEV